MSDDMPSPKPLRYHLDKAREEISEKLQQAYIDGFVADDELDERLDLANKAQSLEDLERLVSDLPEESTALAAPSHSTELAAPTKATSTEIARQVEREERQTLRAIFGAVERAGDWPVPKIIEAQAIFGGFELDFRQTHLPRGEETVIRLAVIMGGVGLILPPGVRIVDNATAILGGISTNNRAGTSATETFHTIRLEGIVFMGGVEIKIKKPPKEKKGIFGFLESD